LALLAERPSTEEHRHSHALQALRPRAFAVRPRDPNSVTLAVRITPVLRAELEAEAWECERTLSNYIRGLLMRRGKWARSIGKSGPESQWDLQADLPPKIGTRAAREGKAKGDASG
jgi:hypothetical protein